MGLIAKLCIDEGIFSSGRAEEWQENLDNEKKVSAEIRPR
jgi:hypothetical protein